MKRRYTAIAAVGFALALPIVVDANVDPAAADTGIASNGQLRGQYAG